MKVIIAGSRTIDNYILLKEIIKQSGFRVKEVVWGGARGVDFLGKLWAIENGITVKPFPAQWDRYGKKAGAIRNEEMACYADALILLWDGKSKGSFDMFQRALEHGLDVYAFDMSKDTVFTSKTPSTFLPLQAGVTPDGRP